MPILDWLLEQGNPSVRYLALRHLLGRGEYDAHVRETRAAIPESAIVRRIFAKQAPEGHWGDPATPYLLKYKATYWTLMLLGYLGLSRDDERVRRAAEYVFGFQTAEGGFSKWGEEAAWREYAHVAERARARGKTPTAEPDFIADTVRRGTLSCLTGNVVAALLRLGYGDDPRVGRAVGWLVRVQNSGGGWLTLAFSWFYGYNILRGLWADPRMDDALNALHRKRTPDGTWILESTPQGRLQTGLERKGQPSKWLTLMALWTMRAM